MVSQIHAYEFDDEIRGAYWDIWREYAEDDADFLLSVPSSMLHLLEQVVAEAGYGMHKHHMTSPIAAGSPALSLVHGDLTLGSEGVQHEAS